MDDEQREAWRERNRVRAEYAAQIRTAASDEQALDLVSKFGAIAYNEGWNNAMMKIAELADEWKR